MTDTTTFVTVNGSTWTVEREFGEVFVTRTATNDVIGGAWASGMTVRCDDVVTTPRPGGTALRVEGGRMDRVLSGVLV
jgi:hypothetical protein